MARYVGVLTMHAGEDKPITFSPPADEVNAAPNISDWDIEIRFTWTDGTAGFTKSVALATVTISTPDYQTTILRADALGKAGKRLSFQSRRVDAGFETELDYGFINVLP